MKSRAWTINKVVDGLPKKEDFSVKEEELPPCQEGDVILESVYLSVDPYMRYRLKFAKVGDPLPGQCVAKVVESKNKDYPVGSHFLTYHGWRTASRMTKEDLGGASLFPNCIPVPDIGSLPLSLTLGVLGMPGNTAYFGLLDLCEPKEGETVLVNGAAGAVGSCVCQIAKIKGCKVIAFAGSETKVQYVKELGADHVFNYKTTNISDALKQCAPDGVNCYFDNVGGDFTTQVIPHLAERGRVSICGAISRYNDTAEEQKTKGGGFSEVAILSKQLRVEGFIVLRWLPVWNTGIKQLVEWVNQGKLKYQETITEGFENMPDAFLGLFRGDNIGKAIVKA